MIFRILILLILLFSGQQIYADTILVVRMGSQHFTDVLAGMNEEIDGEYEVVDYVMTKGTSYMEFSSKVRQVKPDLLVLMDNLAVYYAQEFNLEIDDYASNLPSVVTMGLNLKSMLRNSSTICGVAYEVPAYSIITQFRHLADLKIKRVLVFYRSSLYSEIISDAEKQLKLEGVELVAVDVEGSTSVITEKKLKRAMKDYLDPEKIDLMWVISDSGLLTRNTFGGVWVKTARSSEIPFVSGIDRFVSSEMQFCSYSASPNHEDLGRQVAEMVFSILDDGESPEDIGVEYILSVKESINRGMLLKKKITVREENLKEVRVLK